MKDPPLVALVVPVHNNKEDTREFLESLKQLTYPYYKTIIIDDGSTDGTEEMIKEEYPEVILLKGDGNLWSSGATNMGIEKAIDIEAKYVLIVDNDTVVASEFISALVDTAEKNPNSIISPKVYYHHDTKRIQSAGWKWDWLKLNYTRSGNGQIDQGQYDAQCDIVCATMGTFVNIAVFKDIGMMDTKDLPMYGADQDFTLRARKREYRIIYEPRSMIWHKEMTTAGKGIPNATSLWSRLKYLTTDIRSHGRWHTHRVMIFRHYPKYLILPALIMYVLKLVVRMVRNTT